jgi:hypothetical protein
MRTTLDDVTGRRRIVWIGVGAVAFVAALLLIGETGRPELGFVLIAVVIPVLFVIGQIHGRRTREGTDERARELHRRAASFAFAVGALVLTGTTAWIDIRHGIAAAEPYLVLTTVLLASYVAAVLWHRWRG